MVTQHFPEVNSQFSSHSSDGFVLVAGIGLYSAVGFVGVAVFSYPGPRRFDEIASQLWTSSFEYWSIA
jgi:hypothetical protein